jgi:hypothetical protein
VGFEPTIPVIQQAKTVHVLDRAATIIAMKQSRINLKALFRTLLGENEENLKKKKKIVSIKNILAARRSKQSVKIGIPEDSNWTGTYDQPKTQRSSPNWGVKRKLRY